LKGTWCLRVWRPCGGEFGTLWRGTLPTSIRQAPRLPILSHYSPRKIQPVAHVPQAPPPEMILSDPECWESYYLGGGVGAQWRDVRDASRPGILSRRAQRPRHSVWRTRSARSSGPGPGSPVSDRPREHDHTPRRAALASFGQSRLTKRQALNLT
jgi:hypothetical protein